MGDSPWGHKESGTTEHIPRPILYTSLRRAKEDARVLKQSGKEQLLKFLFYPGEGRAGRGQEGQMHRGRGDVHGGRLIGKD